MKKEENNKNITFYYYINDEMRGEERGDERR
jgi:hypothetical protein